MSDPFESFADIEEIAERLRDADPVVRRLAVKDLGETAQPEAIPHLAAALADAASEVRLGGGSRALGDFDGADVAAALARGLLDAEPAVRAGVGPKAWPK